MEDFMNEYKIWSKEDEEKLFSECLNRISMYKKN
jgi:hypothetical protein